MKVCCSCKRGCNVYFRENGRCRPFWHFWIKKRNSESHTKEYNQYWLVKHGWHVKNLFAIENLSAIYSDSKWIYRVYWGEVMVMFFSIHNYLLCSQKGHSNWLFKYASLRILSWNALASVCYQSVVCCLCHHSSFIFGHPSLSVFIISQQ